MQYTWCVDVVCRGRIVSVSRKDRVIKDMPLAAIAILEIECHAYMNT